jgi:four helix bundle protein
MIPAHLLSSVRDHRSLKAWKYARKVSFAALDASREYWKPYAAAVFGQLQRSALSVQLNIAEGYALGGRRSFANHLRIAYGSAVETCDLLEVARDRDLVPADKVEQAIADNRTSQQLLLGLIKRYRGHQE